MKEREKEKGEGKKENTQWQPQTLHSKSKHSRTMGMQGANPRKLGCGLGDLPPSSCETGNNSFVLLERAHFTLVGEKKGMFDFPDLFEL